MTGTETLIKPCVGHPDCTNAGRRVRGMCVDHYQLWYRNGGKAVALRYSRIKDPIAKLHEASTVTDHGCWSYTRSLDSHGYARVWVGGKVRMAYKYVYELTYGRVPAGLHLDHLCNNTTCWNPDHLDPVTARINLARGSGMAGAWAWLRPGCVCCNRWAESCPEHGQLHWRDDWQECLEAIYGKVLADA